MTETVTRFAPSPTGLLHLGHVHSALSAWRAAQSANGRFILRIEDIDAGRCRPEFVSAIFEDLGWLGLTWPEPVRRQSEHMEDYAAALGQIENMELIYPCFCTRADIKAEIARAPSAPHGREGPVYPGTCRRLPQAEREARRNGGAPYAWRLDMGRALAMAGALRWRDLDRGEIVADPSMHGDVVVARKDVPASYHLAVTVDDALQGVTLIVRGADLVAATDVHRLLQALLRLPVPDYRHHRLLLDPAGKRLAKRDRAVTVRSLRDQGRSPAEVRAMAGFPD